MNAIVGVIVNSVNTRRKEIKDYAKVNSDSENKENVTFESFSNQRVIK
jgi:hypothetical protein